MEFSNPRLLQRFDTVKLYVKIRAKRFKFFGSLLIIIDPVASAPLKGIVQQDGSG